MLPLRQSAASLAGVTRLSPAMGRGNLEADLSCRIVAGAAVIPAGDPRQALAQLSEQIRSVLISLLSYSLQSPLSTIQTTVETLFEGDTIPAQAQRSMIELSLLELNKLSLLVESFLSYVNQVWALTLDFSQFRPSQKAATYLKSVFAALPDTFEHAQPWIEEASIRLMPFLKAMSAGYGDLAELIWPQERDLLEQEWRQTLAIVGHELRTPFTTLRVCLETLAAEGEAPAAAKQALLEVASDDLNRLRLLGQDLELLSRLSARQVWFRAELVDLTAILQATLSSFVSQAPKTTPANIQIEAITGDALVWADGDHLVEVIQRLLENAGRFTAATGAISIRSQVVGLDEKVQAIRDKRDESSTLAIDISDSGQGIGVEQLACVFECFYQEAGYLRRTQGGMGIGLTICRYLIEGMGGHIWAESPGKAQGSRFCLRLPVHREQGRG